MPSISAFLFSLALCFSSIINAQSFTFSGSIYDSLTKRSLPFVNIVIDESPYHVFSTDVAGKFEFTTQKMPKKLTFSYVGYHKHHIQIKVGGNYSNMRIVLIEKPTSIEKVDVKYKGNPALRIINKVIDNRKINNPDKLSSYQYYSYNKFYIGIGNDSIYRKDSASSSSPFSFQIDIGGVDTSQRDTTLTADEQWAIDSANKAAVIDSFSKSMHLFMMESIAQVKYRRPNLHKERIIANRVSGLENPDFFVLASEIQSFSIYNSTFMVFGRDYLSPLSPGATNKYAFILEDTSYSGEDTVFIIKYFPLPNTNFYGLKGLLYINTDGYAIEKLVTSPENNSNNVTINQLYEKIQDSWFPTQLNADMLMKVTMDGPFKVYGVSRTYHTEIRLNDEIKRNEFDHINIELEPNAQKANDSIWEKYRRDSLDAREKNTYVMIDSISKEENLEKKLQYFSALFSGQFGVGPMNIGFYKLLGYNQYEGYSPELALSTNRKFSKKLYLEGMASYGFKDKEFKYGGLVRYQLNRRHDIRWLLRYHHDVKEAGNPTYFQFRGGINEGFRQYILNDLYRETYLGTGFRIRLIKYLVAEVEVNQTVTDTRHTLYDFKNINGDNTRRTLFFENQFVANGKYAYNEKLALTNRSQYSYGTKFPVLRFKYVKSFPMASSNFLTYDKLDLLITHSFPIRNLGRTYYQIEGGKVWGDIPYYLNYFGKGTNYKNAFLLIDRAFQTMSLQKFVGSESVSLFVKHSFGKLLINRPRFAPTLEVSHSVQFLRDTRNVEEGGIEKGDLSAGYYEVGISAHKLINFNAGPLRTGYGFGIYYAYGPYSSPKTIENFALRLSIKL